MFPSVYLNWTIEKNLKLRYNDNCDTWRRLARYLSWNDIIPTLMVGFQSILYSNTSKQNPDLQKPTESWAGWISVTLDQFTIVWPSLDWSVWADVDQFELIWNS